MAAIIVVCVLALVLMVNHYKNSEGFLRGTTLNGSDVEGFTPEEIVEEYAKSSIGTNVEIVEDGVVQISGSLEDFGYSLDTDVMLEWLQSSLEYQKSSITTIFNTLNAGYSLNMEKAYVLDEDVLSSYAAVDSFLTARVETVQPELVLDDETKQYIVTTGVQGNMIDEEKFRSALKETLESYVSSGDLPETITFEIPDDVYTSDALNTDTASLQAEADEKNAEQLWDDYKDLVITYTFGDETEELTSDTFLSWLSMDDDGSISVDADAAADFVSELAATYNTRHSDRTFTATTGQTITFAANDVDYGYIIDEDAETTKLIANLEAGESVTREPVYVETNDYGNPYYYSRNGQDDLNGTYVEVNLTQQHLWFYVDGQLIVESDIVTGDVSKNQQTKTGIFPLAYKESPSTLVGANYSVEVEYWMPFFEGQGLHDASWRTSFGGDIYQTNGSNGCVNLPADVAATIFENIHAGVAIVIYNEDSSSTPSEAMKDASEAVDAAAASAE